MLRLANLAGDVLSDVCTFAGRPILTFAESFSLRFQWNGKKVEASRHITWKNNVHMFRKLLKACNFYHFMVGNQVPMLDMSGSYLPLAAQQSFTLRDQRVADQLDSTKPSTPFGFPQLGIGLHLSALIRSYPTCVYIYIRIYIYISLYIFIYLYLYLFIYVFLYLFICLLIYLFIYIFFTGSTFRLCWAKGASV